MNQPMVEIHRQFDFTNVYVDNPATQDVNMKDPRFVDDRWPY